MKDIGKMRPCYLICAVALLVDGQFCPSDSHRPRVRGRIAHREISKGLVGKGPAVAAGNEDGHMLRLRELLQTATQGANIIG